jgi:hypothetical protein
MGRTGEKTILDRIRSFYEEELDAARAGDTDRLAALAPKRRAMEADVAALAARPELVERAEQLEELLDLARRSHAEVGRLGGCVVEGLGLLRELRRAYRRPPSPRGALVDREG